MLARLLTPTSGTITFGDLDVTGPLGQALVDYRRNTVGIVFQAFNLIPSLTRP
jgi:putative ABC transport system ATP-binding protein